MKIKIEKNNKSDESSQKKMIHIPSNNLHESLIEELFEDVEIHELSEGSCFGENAIIFKLPRTQSAVAVGDVDLFSLNETIFNVCFSVK